MGFSSRKFLLTLIGLVLVTIFSLMSIWYMPIAGLLPTFIAGILGVLGLYFGGNVANKFVVGKPETLEVPIISKTEKISKNQKIKVIEEEKED